VIAWSKFRRISYAAERKPLTVQEMAEWMLGYCVCERRCEAGQVAVISWFKKPVAELQAQSVADMALFYAGRDYALEQGWIEDGPRTGMIRLTQSGYQRATSRS
jgi:hypothetical protein